VDYRAQQISGVMELALLVLMEVLPRQTRGVMERELFIPME
jgi:hypothetical protein